MDSISACIYSVKACFELEKQMIFKNVGSKYSIGINNIIITNDFKTFSILKFKNFNAKTKISFSFSLCTYTCCDLLRTIHLISDRNKEFNLP